MRACTTSTPLKALSPSVFGGVKSLGAGVVSPSQALVIGGSQGSNVTIWSDDAGLPRRDLPLVAPVNEPPLLASALLERALIPMPLRVAVPANSLHVLRVGELCEYSCQRFAFEAKLVAKYGTYKAQGVSYPPYIRCDFTDAGCCCETVTLVITHTFFHQFKDVLQVDSFYRIEGASVSKKASGEGGTCNLSLHVNATTTILKVEPFEGALSLYPERSIACYLPWVLSLLGTMKGSISSTMGMIAYVVIKVDKGTALDKIIVVDGPERRHTLSRIVQEFNDYGIAIFVLRNVGVLQKKKCLAAFDFTTFVDVPKGHLRSSLKEAFTTQIMELGYGQKVPSLKGRIRTQDGSEYAMLVKGVHVDLVLRADQAFLNVYLESVVAARSMLLQVKPSKTFTVNSGGFVISYTNSV
ncbi:hypothetical protein L7F22_054898 [Adiantum nelumboides]|nr:hypothetical protein [Adiantum nelumboides]